MTPSPPPGPRVGIWFSQLADRQCFFPGDGGLFVAVWVAGFNPVPALCTGRFARVTAGNFIMTEVTDPSELGGMDPVGYSWSGEGTLTYSK